MLRYAKQLWFKAQALALTVSRLSMKQRAVWKEVQSTQSQRQKLHLNLVEETYKPFSNHTSLYQTSFSKATLLLQFQYNRLRKIIIFGEAHQLFWQTQHLTRVSSD